MTSFVSLSYCTSLRTKLLEKYDNYMYLKIFVDEPDTHNDELKNKYIESVKDHHLKMMNNMDFIDAGFDLYAPSEYDEVTKKYVDTMTFPNNGQLNKVDFKIKCSAKICTATGSAYNTGYYMYPRSSLSKSKLRLANCTGIIDSGYRGNLISMFDQVTNDNKSDFVGQKFDRYIQICAPSLVPIVVQIVDSLAELGEETVRGAGSFGSTGR